MKHMILEKWTQWPVAYKLLVVFGVLCHFGFGLFYATSHYFIPDEMVYLMMNEALSQGRLALDTGYEHYATPMFVFGLSILHEGKVYAQYPAVYSFLSLPFYLAAGKAGLVFLNQLCFVLIGWLVYRIQKLLFDSQASAALACALALLGGYVWVYAQAVAPHLLQLTLLLAAAWLMLRAFLQQSHSPSRDYLLAGLSYGLALGVRYDSLFALPMLLLPLVFAKPVRWRPMALLLPGIVFALLLLGYTNGIKFGSFAPISYASTNPDGHISVKPIYYAMAAFGMTVLAVCWWGWRLQLAGKLPAPKKLVGVAALPVLALLVAFASPVLSFLYGFIITVIDFSRLAMDTPLNTSAARTENGGFLYLGEYKRALLQSAPFIAMLVLLPLAGKLKLSKRDGLGILWLMLLPAAFIFFFSMTAWHGGFAYHMRYYTPVLPFLAMAAAQLFVRLLQVYGLTLRISHWLTPCAAGAVLAVAAVLYMDHASPTLREWMMLNLPLWCWGLVALAVALAFYDGAGRFVRQLAIMCCAFTMSWGAASTLLVVFPHLNMFKTMLEHKSTAYEPYLANKAVVISVPRHFTAFAGRRDRTLYIATIFSDGETVTRENMRGMIAHFLDKGYGVYITHDMQSLPILRQELAGWGMREVLVRPFDRALPIPALSQFVYADSASPAVVDQPESEKLAHD